MEFGGMDMEEDGEMAGKEIGYDCEDQEYVLGTKVGGPLRNHRFRI